MITVNRVITATNFFGNATPSQDIIKKKWNCSGDEQELLDCPQVNKSKCDHDRDAGVFCYGIKDNNYKISCNFI